LCGRQLLLLVFFHQELLRAACLLLHLPPACVPPSTSPRARVRRVRLLLPSLPSGLLLVVLLLV
jgi:hypothetical protein